jgi:lysophospholipase L1-like esterase
MVTRLAVAILLAAAMLLQLVPSARAEDKAHTIIVHFGDSTCMTTYLPAEHMVDAILNVRLKAHYKTADIVNVNVAEGGDSVRRFLDNKRYERDVKDKLRHIDIAFIRYGMNDMDRRKNDEYKKDLEELCDRVAADYPGVHIILESNMFVPWLSEGHNKRFNEVWDVARQIAIERKYEFVEAFERMKKEAECGNKDLCIRAQGISKEKFGRRIVDDVVDKEMASTPDWFHDAHPNYNANKMIADEELKLLIKLWPEKLPTAASAAH